jgi:hypothetical protein
MCLHVLWDIQRNIAGVILANMLRTASFNSSIVW